MRFFYPSLFITTLILFVSVAASVSAESITIYELQHSTAGNDWKSAYDGQDVTLTGGIVTHIAGFRFSLQDPTLGNEWAACQVRAFESEAPLRELRVGDLVVLTDVNVQEFRGGTIPQYKSYSSFEIISSGNPLPPPLLVPISDLAHPPNREKCEKYEAMLIAVEDIRIGEMDFGKAEDNYALVSGDYSLWASDYSNLDLAMPPFPTYYVNSGERYARFQGIYEEYLHPQDGWDYYQLLPRGDDDYERSTLFTIRDIQESGSEHDWDSTFLGEHVSVQAIVYNAPEAGCRLIVGDPLLGLEWAGLVIDDPAGELTTLAPGDEILFSNLLVEEENDLTLLRYENESSYQTVSTANPVSGKLADPARLALGASTEEAEPLEGMLLSIFNATVTQCGVDEGSDFYYLESSGHRILCTDRCSAIAAPDSTFFVREGDDLGRIRGVLLQDETTGGSAYILHPRGAEDYLFTSGSYETISWGRLKLGFR
jgi:hypothetical protein